MAPLVPIGYKPETVKATHVGWDGRTAEHSTDMDLGRGSSRGVRQYGIRRALWDFAFGYVSGIPLRSIAYYLLTRSFSRHVARWAMKREGTRFDGWLPIATVEIVHGPTQPSDYETGGLVPAAQGWRAPEGSECFIPNPAPFPSRTRIILAEAERRVATRQAEQRRKRGRKASRAGMRRSMPEATAPINRGRLR